MDPATKNLCGSDPTLVGDPVSVATGAVVDRQRDLLLPGPLPLEWLRHYDGAKRDKRLSLGWGHAHEFDCRLRFDVDGLALELPPARRAGFPPLMNDGDRASVAGMTAVRVDRTTYRVDRAGEPSMTFRFANDRAAVAPLGSLTRGKHTIAFQHDPSGRVTGVTHSTAQRLRVAYDAGGKWMRVTLLDAEDRDARTLLEYQFDAAGNLVKGIDAYKNAFTFKYDSGRRLVRKTDRLGFSFHYTYGANGRCVHTYGDGGFHDVRLRYIPEQRCTIVTRTDQGETTYLFDASGALVRRIAPDGGSWSYLQDEQGRACGEVDPNGNVTRTIFGPTGAPVAKALPNGRIVPASDDGSDPRPGHRVANCAAEWEFGRMIQRRRLTPPPTDARALFRLPPAVARAVQTARDEDAPARRVNPETAAAGPTWFPTPQTGRVFSELGKLVGQHGVGGAYRRWTYDANGNVARHVDFDGRAHAYEYAGWNLTACATPPAGPVKYEWTKQEKLAATTDPAGNRREYGYDLCDRLTSVRRLGALRESYRRDHAGNLVEKLDASGETLLRVEVGAGNLPAKLHLASGETHEYAYDKLGRFTRVAAGEDVDVTFAYDPTGRRVADLRGGVGVTHRSADWEGPEQTTVLGKFTTTIRRMPRRVRRITDPTGRQHTIEVLDHGLVVKTLSNGTVEHSQFDAYGNCLMKAVAHKGRADHPWLREYRYSGEGDLLETDDRDLGKTRYEYDSAGRLAAAVGTSGRREMFDYDIAGNLLRQPGLEGTEVAPGNRLVRANGAALEFNARDHVTVRHDGSRTTTYAYDSRDRMTSVEAPGLTWSARYDPLARRQWIEHADGRRTQFYWDTDRLAAEVDPDGRVRVYVYADALALTPFAFVDYDDAEAEPADGTLYFVFCDQRGTPILVEDIDGHAVWRARVEPYGRANVSAESTIDLRLRFPGHHFDAETGLHYNRFRYYSPELGRYLASDPSGIAGGENLYAYTASPLSRVDVRGLECEECKAKGKKGCECDDDDEKTRVIPPPMQVNDDDLFGAPQAPWEVRPWMGEPDYPPSARVVQPGEPLELPPYTDSRGRPGKYIYVIDQNGNMIVAPEHGGENGSFTPDGSPRRTTHVDLNEGQPGRIAGEIVPTNDPNVWVMNDDSGRYSRRPAEPGETPDYKGLVPTKGPEHLQNANEVLNQADLGNNKVYNETDTYGEQYDKRTQR